MKKEIVTAVYALIRDKNNYLFIRRSLRDTMPGEWELPGGKIDFGEEPKESLMREVREEAGLDIEVLKPVSVVSIVVPDRQILRVVYNAVLKGPGKVTLSAEHIAFKWSDFSDPEFANSVFLQKVYSDLKTDKTVHI